MPFPLDEKYIIETEKELEIVFPSNFRIKMMHENGGELVIDEDYWQLHPFFDKSDKKRINRTCNHIGLETKEAKTWHNFPRNGITIASNGSGDHLILLPSKRNNEKLGDEIYTWYHETGKIEKVADNIDKFFDN